MKALLVLFTMMILPELSQATELEGFKGCIRNNDSIVGKENIIQSIEKRTKTLIRRRALLIEKQKLLSNQIEGWDQVQLRMIAPSIVSLIVPGIGVGKLAAAWDFKTIVRTSYATSVISSEILDYYVVGAMTSIFLGGVIYPQAESKIKYSLPKLTVAECNSDSKVIMFKNYGDIKNFFIKRTHKNENIHDLLSQGEKELVNKFDPGFWHFIKNTLLFGADEGNRLDEISKILSSQVELIDQELFLLDHETDQISQMKICSKYCEVTLK